MRMRKRKRKREGAARNVVLVYFWLPIATPTSFTGSLCSHIRHVPFTSHPLHDFLHVSLRYLVRPVQHRLPHDGRNGCVVPSSVGMYALLAQVRPPSPLCSGHALPPRYLPLVICSATPGVEATIPLKPTSRILVNDPSFLFPERLILPRHHAVFVGRLVVPSCTVHVRLETLKPL